MLPYLMAALVGHFALWVEFVNRLHGLGWRRAVIDGLTALCGVCVVTAPLLTAGFVVFGEIPGPLRVYLNLCVAALVLIISGRALLAWDPWRLHPNPEDQTETLDLAERVGEAATPKESVARLARLPGNQLLKVSLETRSLPCDERHSALHGMKIAQLTDLHMSGRLGVAYYEEVVGAVNEWEPDLVCVTGDIVENTPQLDWIESTLGRLGTRHGVFFILGNHDRHVDPLELRERLRGAGLRDAGIESHSLSTPGGEILICGDERPWFGDGPQIGDTNGFVLCLSHSPDQFGSSARLGVDLVLSGHTHGGQVCFPILGPLLCPSKHGTRYAAGTFRRGKTVMHVSRGTGSLFPLRYGCPPEIGLFTLGPN